MPGSPYRTPPFQAPPTPPPRHADDSALPIVALAIVLVALAPPLTFGAVSIWLGVHAASAELRHR